MNDKLNNPLPDASPPSDPDFDGSTVDGVALSPEEQMSLAVLRRSLAEIQYKISLLVAHARARQMPNQGELLDPPADSHFDDSFEPPMKYPDWWPDHMHPRKSPYQGNPLHDTPLRKQTSTSLHPDLCG